MKTVERIIGFKKGTGGSAGVSYLKSVLDHQFFPELMGCADKSISENSADYMAEFRFNFYIVLPLIVRLLSEGVNFQSFPFRWIKGQYCFSSRQLFLCLSVNNEASLATPDNCPHYILRLKW